MGPVQLYNSRLSLVASKYLGEDPSIQIAKLRSAKEDGYGDEQAHLHCDMNSYMCVEITVDEILASIDFDLYELQELISEHGGKL